ncbi:MAG: two-component sensor histidine kinase [Desulfobacterales bacterium]|uniref:histidine kinase n=1 Tax=Candidatus Desulfatibia vada TaxID=2841696 RepID=A0A8J6TPE8_9BACT|nr:two-component sensor histidine kinase [Candidatus Desulfatibia vada]MBL6972723.1 two-component sensor histidine kinase [Desulfobacterales bacterium]
MNRLSWYQRLAGSYDLNSGDDSPDRYRILRRNIVVLMLLVTIIPLVIMAVINQHEYQKSIQNETVTPLATLASKTRHSFELFLEERQAIVKSISSLYSFESLSDPKTLNRIFSVLTNQYLGLIDLGLIDAKGIQLSYTGPYDFLGKDYSQQSWFREVLVKGVYISDVFMGYRQFPHVAIAVLRRTEDDRSWVLRATIDTSKFDDLISSMGLTPESDAFLINRKGTLQTTSRFYGKVLDTFPLSFPQGNYGTVVVETTDSQGREILVAYAPFIHSDYILVLAKLRSTVLRSWYALQSRMLFIFIFSVVTIVLIIIKLTDNVVKRVKEADERREIAFREVQHTHKLSSIGRLAAGVAHEINNPMAIINEKAGLMQDLVEYDAQFRNKDKFIALITSILKSVERCKSITHRLLGFARHMEVQLEILDLNDLVQETLGFLENEALFRNIDLQLQLANDLPRISSNRGQLQQVFLNILSNAFAAVEDGGKITLRSWEEDADTVAVSVQDNGCGMSAETLKHVFEPFFTTKKQHGTGLGLSITYGIVKKIGGDVRVTSKEGEGTTFTAYLRKKAKFGSGE